jgi:Uma2 family endonuclease
MSTLVAAPERSLPQPDVQVREHQSGDVPSATIAESLAIFEVISPSNRRTSLAWRQQAFASIPNLQHYVTFSQRRIEVIRHDRADDWKARPLRSASAKLQLPALGTFEIPIADLYEGTPLAHP